jgi:hypothetical protein
LSFLTSDRLRLGKVSTSHDDSSTSFGKLQRRRLADSCIREVYSDELDGGG